MSKPFIRVDRVSKRHGAVPAVVDASLEVAAGESVVVLGPSGSGKTTLLRLIAGLERPDSGEIWLDGQVVSGPGTNVPPHQRAIGFVFQDLALWPHLTTRRQLDFVMRARRVATADRSECAHRMLRLVRAEQFEARYPHELSGGEQQRVAIARALVGGARLLLLDEPLSSLDAELRVSLRHELRQLQLTLGLSTVYVTHDREDATVLADRVVEMRTGTVV